MSSSTSSSYRLALCVASVGLAVTAGWLHPAASAAAAAGGVPAGHIQSADVDLAACTITGTEYGESLQGTDGDDVICGLGGDDRLFSSPGNDTYIGGDGIDWIFFAYTNVPSGVKADLLTGTATGHGNDTINGIENLYGTPYRDVLRGDSRNYLDYRGHLVGNSLSGGGLGDVLSGRGGNDTLHGAQGNDILIPGPGDDAAYGEAGVDTISFKHSTRQVTVDMAASPSATGQGIDYAYGENVVGSAHDDTITGSREGYGSNARDANVLWGLAGDDTLSGGSLGDDKLFGQAGDDHLDGGTGSDRCDGGPDTDTATDCETQVSIP
jgi:Ca2+-binding RTX toxin-like protein